MFHYSNNQYPFSHIILYGCWNVTNCCWASTKGAFCCFGACSSKLMSTARFAKRKTDELAVSLVRTRSAQIPSKLGLSKDIENGPWLLPSKYPVRSITINSFQWSYLFYQGNALKPIDPMLSAFSALNWPWFISMISCQQIEADILYNILSTRS